MNLVLKLWSFTDPGFYTGSGNATRVPNWYKNTDSKAASQKKQNENAEVQEVLLEISCTYIHIINNNKKKIYYFLVDIPLY